MTPSHALPTASRAAVADSIAAAAPPAALQHLPALDGLRGLAILLVIAHNTSTIEMPAGQIGRLVDDALDLGWIGVQLFFVLSGFLITRILLHTRDAPNYFGAFFGRRVLRIFPLYYGALFVAFALVPLLGVHSEAVSHDQPHQLWLWLYLSNWTGLTGFDSSLFPHFWSLAIEEQFYLLWPLLVLRLNARQLVSLCLALAAASLASRGWMLWQGAPHEHVYTYTVCRMDALALGAAVAAWLQWPGVAQRLAAQRHRWAAAAGAMFLAGVVATHGYPRSTPMGQTLGYSWLAVTFVMGVLAIAASPPLEPARWHAALRLPWLRRVGLYSYAMYVFHKPLHDHVGMPVLMHFGIHDVPSYAVGISYVLACTVASFLAAMLSYHLIEKHLLKLKRLFVARPASA